MKKFISLKKVMYNYQMDYSILVFKEDESYEALKSENFSDEDIEILMKGEKVNQDLHMWGNVSYSLENLNVYNKKEPQKQKKTFSYNFG